MRAEQSATAGCPVCQPGEVAADQLRVPTRHNDFVVVAEAGWADIPGSSVGVHRATW